MMKNILIIIALLALVVTNSSAQSSDQGNTSYTQTEKLLDATIICLDAAEAPTKYNEFAKQFINVPTFPIKQTTQENFQKDINDWLVANPLQIEKILIERKKAHDILYGPRPY